jgi:hypothetical protein
MSQTRPSVRTVLTTLVTIAFAVLLVSPAAVHVHSGESGFYDTACPLAELAARQGDVSLPSAPVPPAMWRSVETAPVVAIAPIVPPFVSTADPRAPPLG